MDNNNMIEVILETKDRYDRKLESDTGKPFIPKRNYCSSIGDPCLRYLVLQRIHGFNSDGKKDIGLQRILNRGSWLERYMVIELGSSGFEIDQEQFRIDFTNQGLNLSGKGDWLQRFSFGWIPIEMKVISFPDRIKSAADFMKSDQRSHRKYVYQLTAAMVYQEVSVGAFLVFDPLSFDWKLLPLELNWDFWEEIVERCRSIEDHLQKKTLPDRIEYHETWCGLCQFKDTCWDNVPIANYEIMSDPELIDMLDRREQLRELFLEYGRIEKSLKSRLPEQEGVIRAGSYEIVSKLVERQAYSVLASQYIKRNYRRI